MGRRFNVYGIGNAIMDLQVRIDDQAFESLKLKKGSMRLIDPAEHRRLMEYLRAAVVHHASGGSGANTIISVAQLGGSAAYASLVGDDEFGRFYQNEMENLGISFQNTPVRGYPTGTSILLITPDAERTMNTHLGVTALISHEHVSEELLTDAEWLYVEGYLFASEGGRAAIEKAVSVARRAGVKVALTLSEAGIVEGFYNAVKQIVGESDLIFGNFEEMKSLTGVKVNNGEAIFAEAKKMTRGCAMTLGKEGARIRIDAQEAYVPAYPVNAVDVTGAGDIFAGGMLYGLTHGKSAKTSATLACFLASRVVTQFGARLKGNVKEIVEQSGVLQSA